MQSVDKERGLAKEQEEHEKSLEEAAFTVPRMFRLTALSVIVVIIIASAILLVRDFRGPEDDTDPSKKDLIGFLFFLAIAGGICSISAQANERERDISELRNASRP